MRAEAPPTGRMSDAGGEPAPPGLAAVRGRLGRSVDGSHEHLRALWGYRWWLLLFVVATTVVTYGISHSRASSYEATAKVQISSGAQSGGNALTNDQVQGIVNTYLQVAQTSSVYDSAGKLVGVPGSEMSDAVTIEAEPNVSILDITAKRGSAAGAARFANVYATALSRYIATQQAQQLAQRLKPTYDDIASLQKQLKTAQSLSQRGFLQARINSDIGQIASINGESGDSARVIQAAAAPGAPSSPEPARDALLALLAALAIGVALAYVVVMLSDHYRTADDAATDLGLPILGEIPRRKPAEQTSVEAFRRLRTSVLFALGETGLDGGRASASVAARRVLVTAAEHGAGKTHTTVHLGRSLANNGWRVLVIDGDLRRPTVHLQFKLRARPGLAEVLNQRMVHLTSMVAQDVPISAAGQARGGVLHTIVAGTPQPDATERLSSRFMTEALDSLSEEYDYFVIDSAPLTPVVDAIVLSRYATGTVFVVDRRTRRREARKAVAALREADAALLGCVFNRTRTPARVYGYVEHPADGLPPAPAEAAT